MRNDEGSADAKGAAALSHLEQALELLDQTELPADIGAHVDLAAHRLRSALFSSELKEQAPGAHEQPHFADDCAWPS